MSWREARDRWSTVLLLSFCCSILSGHGTAAAAEGPPVERAAYIEAARTAMKVGNAEVALPRFNAADALAPLTPGEELERTQALIRLGRAAVATATLQRLTAENPQDPRFEEALTRALLAAGQVEKARARIAAQPKTPHSNGAAAPTAAEREWTIPELEAALESKPGDLWATQALGRALADRGRSAEAAPYLLAALLRLPNDVRLRQEAGVNLLRAGHPREAAEELRRVVQAEPNNRFARNRLAEALLRSGKDAAALRELSILESGSGTRAVRSGADHGDGDDEGGRDLGHDAASLRERKALAQARLARRPKQLAPLEEIYAQQPASRHLGITLAQAYLRLGAAADAATVLEELLRAGQQDAEILRLAARARQSAGLDATEPLRALHLLVPNDNAITRALARAHEAAGRPAQAAALWRELLAITGSAAETRALVRTAWAAGDTATVAELGPRAVASAPEDALLRAAVREALLAQRDWPGALALTAAPGGGSVADVLREARSRPASERLEILERLWAEQPLPPVGRALAEARVAAEEFAAALAGLARVVPPLREAEDDLLRAAAYLGLRDLDHAAAILDRWIESPADERPPQWWRLQAERLLRETGAVDAAIALLADHWRAEGERQPAAAQRLAQLLAWRGLHRAPVAGDDAPTTHDIPALELAQEESLWAALLNTFAGNNRIRADHLRWLASAGALPAALAELASWPPERRCERLQLHADLAAAAHWAFAAGSAADSLAAAGECAAGLSRVRALCAAEQHRAAETVLRDWIDEHPRDLLAPLERAWMSRIPAPLLCEWPRPWLPPDSLTDSTVDPADRLLADAWAIPAQERERARVAAIAIDSLLALHPQRPALQLAAAQIWSRADSLRPALEHYRALLDLNPGRLEWALAEARILTRLGARQQGRSAWQSLARAAPEREDIRREASAAQKRLRGDLRGARGEYTRLLQRWPHHAPARQGLAAVERLLALEREKRRLCLGILGPRPGPGMPLDYLYPGPPPAAGSSYTSSSRHGRSGGVDIGTHRLRLLVGSWHGADVRLTHTSFFAPRESHPQPVPNLQSIALGYRYPRGAEATPIGVVADIDYTRGRVPLAGHIAGGAALVLRQDSQSVFVVGAERRRWAENLDGLLREVDRESAFIRIGTSVMEDHLRLQLHAAGSRLDDDNAFWQGDGEIAIALGPAYQSLLVGARTEVQGFHRQVAEYFSPARFGRLLGTLGWRRRPAADDLTPSDWSWSLTGGFGVEQALAGNAPLDPVGSLDLNVAHPAGPLLVHLRAHLLAAADSHDSRVQLSASYPR
jgi:predicted Zn-dependent protease